MITEAIYNDIKEALTKGLPFASQELQELCKQLIQYKIIEHSISMGILLLIVLIFIIIANALHKESPSGNGESILTCIGLAIIALLFLIVNTYQLIQAIVAPKLYILEYIATHMGG